MVTAHENATATSLSLSPTDERRHYGAMLDIHRVFAGEPQMLVVSDVSKWEIAAGGPRSFSRADDERWSVLAGGRGDDQETASDTIKREIVEEFDELADRHQIEDFPEEIRAAVHGFAALPAQEAALLPFIVGQLRHPTSLHEPIDRLRINEVAASSVVIEFDRFPLELRNAFQYLIHAKLARWIGINDLETAFTVSRVVNDARVLDLPVRPQLLTLAKLHALQKVHRVSDEAVALKVQEWNAELALKLHEIARQNHTEVNNGVFTLRGTIYKNLPEEDMAYLGLNKKA